MSDYNRIIEIDGDSFNDPSGVMYEINALLKSNNVGWKFVEVTAELGLDVSIAYELVPVIDVTIDKQTT